MIYIPMYAMVWQDVLVRVTVDLRPSVVQYHSTVVNSRYMHV